MSRIWTCDPIVGTVKDYTHLRTHDHGFQQPWAFLRHYLKNIINAPMLCP
jgi:hypothetical protein